VLVVAAESLWVVLKDWNVYTAAVNAIQGCGIDWLAANREGLPLPLRGHALNYRASRRFDYCASSWTLCTECMLPRTKAGILMLAYAGGTIYELTFTIFHFHLRSRLHEYNSTCCHHHNLSHAVLT
jgi:hypothetical protein